jgi:hypothetical protein
MKDTSDRYFMMIEPPAPASAPLVDGITMWAMSVRKLAKTNGVAFKGWHTCACGANSDSSEWVMPDGRITNSLMVHYVQCHRQAVPRSELGKLAVYATLIPENYEWSQHGQ